MHAIKKYLSGKTHIIWDWNGTLLDDLDISIATISEILARYQLPPITIDSYRHHFRFPISDYYKQLGFDLSVASFSSISGEFIAGYNERLVSCALFEGAQELLHELSAAGIIHCILSAAHEHDILRLLERYDIKTYFQHVHGLDNHHAVSKVSRGHDLLVKLSAPRTEILMIGDTDHDLEVAKALGIDILLLGDGHQHYERLASKHHAVLSCRR